MNSFRRWLKENKVNEEDYDSVESLYNDFIADLNVRGILLCEADKSHVRNWIRYISKNDYHIFRDRADKLKYAFDYLKHVNIETNFDFNEIYVEFESRYKSRFIKNIMSIFKNRGIMDFGNIKVKALYADYDEENDLYISYRKFDIDSFEYYYCALLLDKNIKKEMILTKDELKEFEVWDYRFEFRLNELRDKKVDWDKLIS